MTPKQERFVDEYLLDPGRFSKYIDSSGGGNACWPWMGARDANGYGRFHVPGTKSGTILAHRGAFLAASGVDAEAVCHRCDNPPCCNPAHLFGGTRADNNQDMVSKGRHWLVKNPSRAARGSEHGGAKLTEPDVLAIPERYLAGGTTQRDLAREFGVCQRTIAKVVNRIGWKHV